MATLRTWWWLPLALAMTGCDARFDVTGKVVEQAGVPKSCRLFIREVTGGLGCCSGTVDPRDIEQQFWVLPGREQYKLVLECPGFEDYSATAIFGVDMSSSKPLDLGAIFLSPKS
jgi:hypothetical protein